MKERKEGREEEKQNQMEKLSGPKRMIAKSVSGK